jgi:protein SCO1
MKRRDFLGLTPALLPAMMPAFGLVACGGKGERAFKNTDHSPDKIFPKASLLGAGGQPRSFEAFRGKVLLVFFGYTNCPEICPTAMRKYASLTRNLRNRDAERFQVLFISVDPARDNPERADTYAKLFNKSFIGLSGTPEQINDLVSQFKLVVTKQAVEGSTDYHLDHGSSAYVMDAKGQWRLTLKESAFMEPIVDDVLQLIQQI